MTIVLARRTVKPKMRKVKAHENYILCMSKQVDASKWINCAFEESKCIAFINMLHCVKT